MGIDKLRTLLVSTAKETAFRKVVQATMVRDRQHGPVLELNREGRTRTAFRRISIFFLSIIFAQYSDKE